MKILNYREREQLKAGGEHMEVDLAHYHRFLESFAEIRANGDLYVSHIPISFKDYCTLKRSFPGWSYGRLCSGHSAWKSEYSKRRLIMNELLDKIR